MLRAIDIASWQAGIRPSQVDCDIVIVKATGGTSYVNPYWCQWVEEALAAGKLVGIYHYCMEYGEYSSAYDEARFFLDVISEYMGRCVPILDFEADAQSLPVSWPREWLDIVARETGSTPFFYCYASYLNSRDHSELTKYPLWMASYLNRYMGGGWVADPVNTWDTGSWENMTMYQYTSEGRVAGYDGDLDLSVFYGTKGDWRKLEGNMGKIEAMVNHAVAIANDDSHGYSWADRWDVDRDCSSLMYDSANAAGYPVGRGADKTRYTGTMIDDFTAVGFTNYGYGSVSLQRGDILLRDPWGSGGHTEMYIGDGMTVGAHIAETGGVYGEPGDQTGYEISVTANPGNWDYVLRPPSDAPEQVPGEPVNDAGLKYRAHCQTVGWLPAVRDGQVAGTTGYAKRLEALKITPPEGWVLEVSMHVQSHGWMTWSGIRKGESSGTESSSNDPIMGTVGEAKRIECLMVKVLDRPAGDNRKLYFQVHQQSTGWKDWTPEGYASGTDGMALRLEAVRMKIE